LPIARLKIKGKKNRAAAIPDRLELGRSRRRRRAAFRRAAAKRLLLSRGRA